MTPGELVVPQALRAAGFVPRQRVGWRVPQRVTPGAFRARGLAIPERREEWNVYRLTGGEGFPWGPPIDKHVRTRGAELRGRGGLVVLDLDLTAGGDGIADLARLAASLGVVPDVDGAVIVATPGHGSHQPGRHLWWRADPSMPVRFGALEGWPRIEIKGNGTCPGSPGYRVLAEPPGGLGTLPRWLARVAGPPVPPVPGGGCNAGPGVRGRTAERLAGVVETLLGAGPGDGRNRLLYWGACRAGEMIGAGELDRGVAERALFAAAEANGHVAKHGAAATWSTIRSGITAGMRSAAVA
jgi:hypothetical protein